jgi:MFS family permease
MLNIILLGLVSLLTDIGSEMIYPLLPSLFISLGLSAATLGFVEGVAESTASLTKAWFGRYSDRIKKRKSFALAGYFVSGLGKLLLPFAAGQSMVFGGRALDRFGKGIRTAPRDALLAENAKDGKTGAAFGLHRALDTLGAVIGVLGAWIILARRPEALNAVFIYALIPTALALAILAFVKEKRSVQAVQKEHAKINFLASWRVLPKNLKIFFAASAIFALGNSSNLFLILKSINIGFAPASALLLYLTYNLSHALVSYPAGRLSDKFGRKTVLLSGYLLYGIVYLLFAAVDIKAAYFLLFIIYGFYAGIAEGVEKALVSDSAPSEQKGALLGMHAALVGAMLFPASLLAGALWQYAGSSSPFFFSSLTSFIAIVIFVKFYSDQ